jgi:hypothetical protein
MAGYIVVAGVRVPIVRVSLREGGIFLLVEKHGPLPAAEGPVTIFGEDDLGVCQTPSGLKWREIKPGETLSLELHLKYRTIESSGMVEASG